LDIHVIPLSVMIDDVVYTDDANLSGEHFMEMMANAKALPKTSQPPIGEFVELYDELGKDGSEIVSIHMAQSLSGTVEAARQATHLTKSKVVVIDSDFTDQSQAFLAMEAAELANQGASLDEVIARVEKVKEHSRLFIGISSLDNLVKGGRISRTKGLLSNFLNIHVVMEMTNAELVPIVKGRGSKTFTKWFETLKQEMQKLPPIKRIGISHAGAAELAEEFKQGLKEIFPTIDIPVLHTGPIIATHTGKKAFAIMFFYEND
jgi:DegV family protein with EDD domain